MRRIYSAKETGAKSRWPCPSSISLCGHQFLPMRDIADKSQTIKRRRIAKNKKSHTHTQKMYNIFMLWRIRRKKYVGESWPLLHTYQLYKDIEEKQKWGRKEKMKRNSPEFSLNTAVFILRYYYDYNSFVFLCVCESSIIELVFNNVTSYDERYYRPKQLLVSCVP